MSLDKIIPFLMSYNTVIIEVLIGLTLLASLFLAVRTFLFAKDPDATNSLAGLGDLEATLKKILEQASQVPTATVVAAAGGSEEGQKLVAEISQLKQELQTKQTQIEELKSSAGAGATSAPPSSGMSDEDKAKLEAQLKELQAKLAEYEIISEDIADLSFYKEQNAKLQKELDALKKGGAQPAAPAAAEAIVPTPAEPTPAPVPAEPPAQEASPAAEPALEMPQAPVEEAVAASDAPAPPAEENIVDDDLMAEFAAAVAKQKGGEPETPAAAPAAPPAAPPPEASIMEEPPARLGEIDVEKMIAEASEIKDEGVEVTPEAALGTSLDESKLLQEATALQGVSPEDKQLMGQFENFVKKE